MTRAEDIVRTYQKVQDAFRENYLLPPNLADIVSSITYNNINDKAIVKILNGQAGMTLFLPAQTLQQD